MKTVHPYYGIKIDTEDERFTKAFESLENHYGNLPGTKCLNCPTKCGVEADCCKVFSPPMLLVEFLYAMTQIEKWDEKKQTKLLYACLESFLNPSYTKPCVLLDDVLCSIYGSRPLSCRLFGLYEDQEYEDRLKKIFGDNIPENTPFIKQCKNLEVDGKENFVSKTKSDAILFYIYRLDISLFEDEKIGKEIVMSSCTYMPFDAHFLCLMYGPDYLEMLTNMKEELRKLQKTYEEDGSNISARLDYTKKKGNIEEFLLKVRESLGFEKEESAGSVTTTDEE